MRLTLGFVVILLCACAGEKLATAPPAGVDFSGLWKLNEADSDDPLRLVLSQAGASGTAAAGSTGSQGGSGGRGGGRGGRGGGGFPGAGVPGGPSMPGAGTLGESLRWPGRTLEIKQVAGVVVITSAGEAKVFQPAADMKRHPDRKPRADAGAPGREPRARDRGDGPPPICGWDDRTLVVRSIDPDEDQPPFEQRYSVSADGQRLIEVVGFKGGPSGGYTISRVWDREAAGVAPAPAPSAVQ